MRIFATENMEEVKGTLQTFEKLCVNGVCLFNGFEEEVKNNPQYYSELKTIVAYMNFVANGDSLPNTIFREIKGGNTTIKQYEFKSKHLRVYACAQKGGKIVIMGGYKTTQPKDILKLNELVKEFITFRKRNLDETRRTIK